MALAAADSGDFETFHDLAWRAIQTGPKKDADLMFLLARAQTLSGRPHDALVTLQRLAEMGKPVDVADNDEFVRTRELPGWPDVAALIDRSTHRCPTCAHPPHLPLPARPAPPAPPAPPALTMPALPAPPALTTTGSRFSIEGFTLGGLAYDAVSSRFLVGDRLGRKLMVVAEGADHAVDFVRAASAGFRDIAAIEIDDKRGDLWVVSAAPDDGAGVLHKLQLASGRPLKSFPMADGLEPVTLVDLDITPAGEVLVLDAAGPQVLTLRPGGAAVERVMKIEAAEPVSLAAGGEAGIAYVADRDGVSRLDLRARTATRVTAPKSVSLANLAQIRLRGRNLFAVRVDPDGTHHIIRFELNANGRAVTKATPLADPVLSAGKTFVAISGNELVYMVNGSKDAADPPQGSSDLSDFVAYRVPLR